MDKSLIIRSDGPARLGLREIVRRNGPNADLLMDFGILPLRLAARGHRGAPTRRRFSSSRAAWSLSGRVRDRRTGERSAARTHCAGASLTSRPRCFTCPRSAASSSPPGPKGRRWRSCERTIRAPSHRGCTSRRTAGASSVARERWRKRAHAPCAPCSTTRTHLMPLSCSAKWSLPRGAGPAIRRIGIDNRRLYHYRFFPIQGFGLAAIGEDGVVIRNEDTVLIRDGAIHPHAAAPGDALWYIWVIRHLEGDRYGVPTFAPEHAWTGGK